MGYQKAMEKALQNPTIKNPYRKISSAFLFLHIFLLCFIYGSLPSAHAAIYNVKDLEALERSGQVREYLDHAFDIRPSERDQHWQEMLSNMAKKYVTNSQKDNEFSERHFQYIEGMAGWQGLKDDEIFQLTRYEYALAYLKNCFNEMEKRKTPDLANQNCKKELNKFWSNIVDKTKAHQIGISLHSLALEWEEKIPTVQFSPQEKWSYLAPGVQSPIGEIYCSKHHVQRGILEKLDDILLQETEDADARVAIKMAISQDCRKVIIPKLVEFLRRPFLSASEATQFETALKTLKLLGQLPKDQLDLLYTLYILKGPTAGEIFNLAWNTVLGLGQSFPRRTKVIEQLKQYDPLPDRAFLGGDPRRAKVLIELLHKNLPEYIDYYAKTCLNYLAGRGSFPNGNPTMACHDFFNVFGKLKNTNPNLMDQYNKLRKI